MAEGNEMEETEIETKKIEVHSEIHQERRRS